MEKLSRFYLQNDEFEIHPLGKAQTKNFNKLADELWELLSNDEVLKYCPDLKIDSKEEIDSYVSGLEDGFHDQTQFSYFIIWLKTNAVIGEIMLLPPDIVKEKYDIEGVWFIRYILNKRFWDHGIMTSMLRMLIDHLKGKVEKLGAISDRENIAAIRILENLNFEKLEKNGIDLEYYELNLKE